MEGVSPLVLQLLGRLAVFARAEVAWLAPFGPYGIEGRSLAEDLAIGYVTLLR
jgi:hypothetical protein